MNKEDLIKTAVRFVENSESNYIAREVAISESVVGMKIFDKNYLSLESIFYFLKNGYPEQKLLYPSFYPLLEWLKKAIREIHYGLLKSGCTDVLRGKSSSENWVHI